MKFMLCYLRNNVRRRTRSYLILFCAFFLSASLIHAMTSFVFLSGRSHEKTIELPFYNVLSGISPSHFDGVALCDDIVDYECFDTVNLTAQCELTAHTGVADCMLVHVPDDSPTAAFLRDAFGLDIAALAENEVYVHRTVLYQLRDTIDDRTLTLPHYIDENGAPMKLKIKAVFVDDTPLLYHSHIIMRNDALFSEIMTQSDDGARYGMMLIETLTPPKPADQYPPDLTRSPLQRYVSAYFEDIGSYSLAGIPQNNDAFYMKEPNFGDAVLLCEAMTVALFAVFASVGLKLQTEGGDYRKMRALGMSPLLRIVLPTVDVLCTAMPPFFCAFLPVRLIFPHLIAKESAAVFSASMQTLTYEYIYRPEMLWVSAALFFGITVFSLAVHIPRNIGIGKRQRDGIVFVKKSAAFYLGFGKRLPRLPFSLRFSLLQKRRYRALTCLFLVIISFSLFLGTQLGVAVEPGGMMHNFGDAVTDADYVIRKLPYPHFDDVENRAEMERVAAILREMEDIAAVDAVFCEQSPLRTEDGYSVRLTQLCAETQPYAAPYLVAGDLDAVMKDASLIAVSGYRRSYAVGDSVRLVREDGGEGVFTVGAVLDGHPWGISDCAIFYLSREGMETLSETETVTLYVHLRDGLTGKEKRAVGDAIGNAVVSPYDAVEARWETRYFTELRQISWARIYRMMQLLTIVIAVFSLFLLYMQYLWGQRTVHRRLMQLGYSAKALRRLCLVGAMLLLVFGVMTFLVTYGTFLAVYYAFSRQLQTVFDLSRYLPVTTVLVIVLCMALAMLAAVFGDRDRHHV